MAGWDKSTKLPTWVQGKKKRNIIATAAGWVRRVKKGSKAVDETLVAIRNLSETSTKTEPKIHEIYVANTTGGTTIAANTAASVFVVFDEPLAFGTGTQNWKITIANTVGGSSGGTATLSNTEIFNADNTLRFTFTSGAAGTYKINAQTIANTGNVVSGNIGAEAASKIISNTVSNALGTFIVT